MVKFGDVVRLNTDRCADPAAEGIERYLGLEHIEPEDLRIRRWGLVAEGTTFTNRFQPGQVLFGKRRAYQRKVAVADFAGVCSGDIYVFEPKDERLLPELLPFLCQTERFFEYAVGTSAGSLSPRTNWTQLANYEFALPPLEEQRRIADIYTRIQAVDECYIGAIERARGLRESIIEHFLQNYSGKKYLYPVQDLLREHPRNGYSPKSDDSGEGIRTVSISAVSNGRFDIDGNIKYAKIELIQIAQFLVRENDVFVIRGNGNRNFTARCGLADQSYDDLFYPDLLIRLRFDEAKVLPKFAVYQWNSPQIHRNLLSSAKSTNGIWKINGQDIRKHRLIVPSLEAQQKLVSEIESVNKALHLLEERQSQLDAIKRVILNN